MIRLPNKLYRFNETVLADFVTILKTLGTEPVPVLDRSAASPTSYTSKTSSTPSPSCSPSGSSTWTPTRE